MSAPDRTPSPGGTTTNGGTSATTSKVLVIILVVLFLVASVGFYFMVQDQPLLDATPTPSGLTGAASPTPTGAPGTSSAPTGTPAASGGANPTPNPSGSSTPTPTPTPTPTTPPALVETDMPIVPVVDFWGTDPGLSKSDLTDALEGHSAKYPTVIVPTEDRGAIAAAAGVTIADSVQSGDAAAIDAAVKTGALGFLRAADVTALVHAVPLEGKQLFGEDRVKSVADWPLTIHVTETADRVWDQSATWTLLAGGDMILDRGIYARVVNQHKGLNYPFDGGTAVVTGRHCCGTYFGYGAFDVPDFHLTGNAGAVRSLVQNADLAIANLEDPTPDNWIFHVFGIPFSGDPALLQMFTNAGIDWVTIANNHIDDYGASGIKDTMRHLPEYGLQFAGAGLNIDQASQYSVLDVHGVKVAILPCVAVFPSEWAKGSSKAGGMPCTDPRMIPNIQKAAAEDDFVIVFPHWGIEYTLVPIDSERKLAAQFMAAGADLILGAHPHVAQAVEDINGKLVFYSMGNFVFDQNWAEITMEGLLVESTFEGKHLMQTQMLPIIDADQSQPNLLDPNGSGKIVLQRMEKASRALGGHGVSDVDRPRIA